MRTAAEALNRALLDRNLGSTTRGQYAVGWLVLAAVRGPQCTLLQSGPTHIYKLDSEAVTHTFDPALSGKGLGLSQAATIYLTQTELHPGDRMVLSGKTPAGWDGALGQVEHDSPEATRRRLFSLSRDDLNAVLIQAREGTGKLTVMRPVPASSQPSKEAAPISEPPAPPPGTESLPPFLGADSVSQPGTSTAEPEEDEEPVFTPSAYAIPPQAESGGLPTLDQVLPGFPASIPRLTPEQVRRHCVRWTSPSWTSQRSRADLPKGHAKWRVKWSVACEPGAVWLLRWEAVWESSRPTCCPGVRAPVPLRCHRIFCWP
jgi:hypothetical protein